MADALTRGGGGRVGAGGIPDDDVAPLCLMSLQEFGRAPSPGGSFDGGALDGQTESGNLFCTGSLGIAGIDGGLDLDFVGPDPEPLF